MAYFVNQTFYVRPIVGLDYVLDDTQYFLP